MRRLTLGVLAAAMLVAGCGGALPGFRFAPAEPQKQTAQVGADLAVVAATSGLPPYSTAAKQMAKSAYAGAIYVGPPKSPTDVSALLPPAVTNAWNIMERRAEAIGLKADVLDRVADVTSERLADMAADMAGEAKVDADRVIFRAAAIVEGQKIGAEIADVIPIPGLDTLSPEEAERMRRLDKALDKIQATAATQAARRPTTGEVVEAAEDQVLSTADKAFGMLEDYGLLALIPGAAGVALAVRKRKQAKTAAEDLKFARVRETQGTAAAAEAVAAARAEAAALAMVAMERLAAAPPPALTTVGAEKPPVA